MIERAKGMAKRLSPVAFALALVCIASTQAQAQVVIPDVGFSIDTAVTEMGTKIGGVLGGVILVAFALYAINYGVKKVRSYTGASK